MVPRASLAATCRVSVVLLLGGAALAAFNVSKPTPDPFGTDVQVLASLPRVLRDGNADRSPEVEALLARVTATKGKFTGRAHELEAFLQILERHPAQVHAAGDDVTLQAVPLTTIARAWKTVGPFEGTQARVLREASTRVDSDELMIAVGATLALHVVREKWSEGSFPAAAQAALERGMSRPALALSVNRHLRGMAGEDVPPLTADEVATIAAFREAKLQSAK